MKVLVDTSVWSLVLRRRPPARHSVMAAELQRLVAAYRVAMIGPVRQEVLSGIRAPEQYEGLRERLHAFPDLELRTVDYELAAGYFNQCRSRGIQGSNTDFLICAVAARLGMSVFSTDLDFTAYARILGVGLHELGG